jgi:hypothetical protein
MRRAAIRGGTRNPVWRLDRRFPKIRSPAKLAASSGLWRQPTLFGIHIVPNRADWTTFVMRLETSNEGEGKKSLPRADDLVRAARVFDHGPIRVTSRRGQPFRLTPGAAARSRHRRAFELLNLRGARQPKAVACILRKDRSRFF